MTRRKILEYWTEVHRIDSAGGVKVTCCCCPAAGATAKGCAIVKRTKTPCRCFCHTRTPRKPTGGTPCT